MWRFSLNSSYFDSSSVPSQLGMTDSASPSVDPSAKSSTGNPTPVSKPIWLIANELALRAVLVL